MLSANIYPTFTLLILNSLVPFFALISEKRTFKTINVFSPAAFFIFYNGIGVHGLSWFIFFTDYYGLVLSDVPSKSASDAFISAQYFIFVYQLSWVFGYSLSGKNKNITFVENNGLTASNSIFFIVLGIALAYILYMLSFYTSGPRSELARGSSGKILFLTIGFSYVLYTFYLERLFLKAKTSSLLFKKGLSYSLALLLCIIMVVTFLQMGGRGRAFSAIIFLLISYNFMVKKFSIAKMSLIAITLIISVLWIPSALEKTPNNSPTLIFYALYDKTHERNFDSVENLSKLSYEMTNNNYSFLYGSSMVQDILGDVTSKAETFDTRDYFMQKIYSFNNDDFGRPITKPGEFYLNFGWLGIVIIPFFLGMLTKRVYLFVLVNSSQGIGAITLYITYMYGTGVFNIDGYFAQSLVFFLVKIFFLIIIAVSIGGWSKIRLSKVQPDRTLST